MKRVISVLLILVLLLSLAACAPQTREEAVEKAEETMQKWDDKTKNMARYETEYNEDLGFFVTVKSLEMDGMDITARYEKGKTLANTVYEELEPILSEFDVDITVTVFPDGELLPAYVSYNGKGLDG